MMSDKQAWQPIETAPTDGTEVLAITDYGLLCVMRWNEVSERLVRVATCRRCDGMGLGSLVAWCTIPEYNSGGESKQ